jgi:hypothetical protein
MLAFAHRLKPVKTGEPINREKKMRSNTAKNFLLAALLILLPVAASARDAAAYN